MAPPCHPQPASYATAGIELVGVFGAFLLGGLLLDRHLDTLPLFTLLLAAAGFAGGLWRLVRQVRPVSRRSGDPASRTESGETRGR